MDSHNTDTSLPISQSVLYERISSTCHFSSCCLTMTLVCLLAIFTWPNRSAKFGSCSWCNLITKDLGLYSKWGGCLNSFRSDKQRLFKFASRNSGVCKWEKKTHLANTICFLNWVSTSHMDAKSQRKVLSGLFVLSAQ